MYEWRDRGSIWHGVDKIYVSLKNTPGCYIINEYVCFVFWHLNMKDSYPPNLDMSSNDDPPAHSVVWAEVLYHAYFIVCCHGNCVFDWHASQCISQDHATSTMWQPRRNAPCDIDHVSQLWQRTRNIDHVTDTRDTTTWQRPRGSDRVTATTWQWPRDSEHVTAGISCGGNPSLWPIIKDNDLRIALSWHERCVPGWKDAPSLWQTCVLSAFGRWQRPERLQQPLKIKFPAWKTRTSEPSKHVIVWCSLISRGSKGILIISRYTHNYLPEYHQLHVK